MKYTNTFNLAPEWQELLTPKEGENKPPEPKRYSVTDLIGPPLIRSLKIDFWDKLSEDITERIWRVDGQLLDDKLSTIAESFNIPGEFRRYLVKYKMERKFEVKDKILMVVGIPDLIDTHTRTIRDWKKTYQAKVTRGDFEEWWAQVGIYAYLYNFQDGYIKESLGCYKIEATGLSIFIKDFKPQGDFAIPIMEFARVFSSNANSLMNNYVRERLLDHYENPYRECLAEEKWMTSDIFAVIKRGNSRALKLCDSEKEANTYINSKKIKDEKNSSLYSIERRPGIPKRCLKYCPVRCFCQYNLYFDSPIKITKKPKWMVDEPSEVLPIENLNYTDNESIRDRPVRESLNGFPSFNLPIQPGTNNEEFTRQLERLEHEQGFRVRLT